MKKVLFVATLVLAACSVAVAQYTTTYTDSVQDVTANVKAGAFAWKDTGGVCLLGSLAVSTNGDAWCVGANGGPPYKFDDTSGKWVEHGEMGLNPVQLIVQNDSNIFSLQANSWCAANTPQTPYDVYHWNGQSWVQPHPNSCVAQGSISVDGFFAVVGWDGNNHVKALFSSTDGGADWTYWSDNWRYVTMWAGVQGCALTVAGTIYEISNSNSPANIPNPTGASTLVGCVNFPLDNDAFVVWDVNGKVFYNDDGTWATISGINAKQIAGTGKGTMFALDQNGHAYHMNMLAARRIDGVTTGNWANFPGMNPSIRPTHTSRLQVSFPYVMSGTGLMSTQTIPYNGNMNNPANAVTPLCDPLLGIPDDPACSPSSGGDNTCSEMGLLNNPQEPSGPPLGISHWFVDRDSFYRSYQDPPVFSANRWHITVHIIVNTVCDVGIPTCKLPVSKLIMAPDVWDLTETVYSQNLPVVQALASVAPYTGPWVVRSSYFNLPPPLISANTCVKLDVKPAILIPVKVCD